MSNMQKELRMILNKYSRENLSNTPDFILAEFMLASLACAEKMTRDREKWYGKSLSLKNRWKEGINK